MPGKNVNKIETNNKSLASKKRLELYLNSYAVFGDGVDHTHTTFGFPWGKYNIPDCKLNEFYDLYCDVLGQELHLTERPKKIGPLLIDIDFKFDEEYDERQYKDNDINYIIGNVNNVIRKYYKWNTKSLMAFVFEKDIPSLKINKNTNVKEYKDGFHIHYPYLSISVEMRFLIIHEIKKNILQSNGFRHIPFKNSLDDVFDITVVQRNGWMMYGSRKHDGPFYYLKKIFTGAFEEEDIKKYKHKDLVKILSNRKFNDNDELEFKDNLNIDLLRESVNNVLNIYGTKKDKLNEKNKLNDKNKNKLKDKKNKLKKEEMEFNEDDFSGEEDIEDEDHSNDIGNIRNEVIKKIKEENIKKNKLSKNKEINMAKKFLKIMTKERATNHKTWIEVGWALHNVSPDLLNSFKEFSKKANNYDEKSCEKVWKNAREGGLQFGSLRHWAKSDNPDKFAELMTECINELLVEAETGTDFDIAKVVYELYKDQYKCTSIGHDVWYEFQRHRWVEIDHGYTLSIKIAEELTKEFALLSSIYLRQMTCKTGGESDLLLQKSNKIGKIMINLKKSGINKNIMEACKKYFYDGEFEEKLDSNNHLLGFNNGVYDLDAAYFRPGSPDDNISLTTGYDYKEFTLDHEHIKEIKDFFCKVQREEDMREYILTLLACYLDGHTKLEQFVLWTGTGCHAVGTPILMYDGSLKMVEDIKIGDKLTGNDYKSRKVKHLYRGKDKMYNVIQSDGTSYVVNSTHRLVLNFNGEIKKNHNVKKNRYDIKWFKFNENNLIKINKKYFNDQEIDKMNDFIDKIKLDDNFIPKNHGIIMTVENYLKLNDNVKEVLVGYKSELIKFNYQGENEVSYNYYNIKIEYVGKNDYYGFEVTENQKYLLGDHTVTCNSNGKSKTVELFQLAFGDYCGVLPITVLTKKRGGSSAASPEMAEMRGKRFVVFQEPENDDQIQVGFMKELTGGDTIYARPLYKDPIRFKPQFKMLLTCNKLPFIPSSDGGTWRRLRVSPWESEFVDVPKYDYQFAKDYDLVEKLKIWKKAFAWYLINIYYPKYKKNGLKEPSKVTQYTKKYQKDSDLFFEYIDNNLTITNNDADFEGHDVLYAGLKYWYGESYSAKCPFSKKQFAEYLQNNNYKTKNNYLYGVKFKSEENNNNKSELDD